MFVVVSYDIKDDKKRTKVHKILKDYGQWIQYSVFECQIDKSSYLRLRARLDKMVSLNKEDSIRFYFLCDKDVQRIERIGGKEPISESAVFIGFNEEE
jgi:CRISPR-associated protein Cas2